MSGEAKSPEAVREMLLKTFEFLLTHEGSGKLEVSMKLLKRGQKEILIQCGRSYRFVVDMPEKPVNREKSN